MHKKIATICTATLLLVIFVSVDSQPLHTPAAKCLAPWSAKKTSVLELSSMLNELEQQQTAPKPKNLAPLFVSIIEDVNDDIQQQYQHRIKSIDSLKTIIPELPNDSTRWTRPVLDFLIERFDWALDKDANKYVNSRFSANSATEMLTALLLKTRRPAKPEQLQRLYNQTLKALQRFKDYDYFSDVYQFETLLATIAACPDLPEQTACKKQVIDRFMHLMAKDRWLNQTDTVKFSRAFFTKKTVADIPEIIQIAKSFIAEVEAPTPENSYGYKVYPSAQIELLERMCDGLPTPLQQRLVKALMTTENGRESLKDTFNKGGQKIIDRHLINIPPEDIEEILVKQYSNLLGSETETQQIIYQLQAIYNSLANNTAAQKAVERAVQKLGFVIPHYPTNLKSSELGNEFYVLPYMKKIYPFVPFKNWNPDMPVMSVENFSDNDNEQTSKDFEFDAKIRELLLLNAELLKETSKTTPSVAELKKLLADFLEKYRKLLDIHARDISEYSKQPKDERQLTDWHDELQLELAQTTATNLTSLAAKISQSGGFVNTIHSQALWLQHTQMSASSVYSKSNPNRLTLYMQQTQVDITNLSGKPLTKTVNNQVEFTNPYLGRIITEIGIIGKQDIENIYMQVRQDTISMHIKVRGHHYAELTLNTKDPEHGGGVTIAFMDPHTLDAERLNRARIIAKAIRMSSGLNPDEKTVIEQHGGFVTGNLNINTGLSSKTHIMQTAMLAFQLFCRSAYIEPRDSDFVTRIVHILLQDNGRLKRSKYFDFLMDKKDSTPEARQLYQRVMHEILSIELDRLELPKTLPMYSKIGQQAIDSDFNSTVTQALDAGQITLDENNIPQKVPDFVPQTKNNLLQSINSNRAQTVALATAISNLKTPLHFKHLSVIGSMPLKQAVLKTSKGNLIFHALFDADTQNCVFATSYLRKDGKNITLEFKQLLELINEASTILNSNLIDSILEFNIQPFPPHILTQKLATTTNMLEKNTFGINNINAASGLITGRLKLDKPNVQIDTGDILITPSIRPRFVDLAQTKAGAIWVNGAANELCHDANVVRELDINCFQLSGTTDPNKNTVTLKQPDGTYVQIRENALLFILPEENQLFVADLNSTNTQRPFFETLANIILHPFMFSSPDNAAASLKKNLLLFEPEKQSQLCSLVFSIYMKAQESALKTFLTQLPKNVTKPSIINELRKLITVQLTVESTFEYDLKQAKTQLEIKTLSARAQNDLNNIAESVKDLKQVYPHPLPEFSTINTDSLVHKLSQKASQAANKLPPQIFSPKITHLENENFGAVKHKWTLTSPELLSQPTHIAGIIGNKGAQLVKMNVAGFAVPVWASNSIKAILSNRMLDETTSVWSRIVYLVETESDTYSLLNKISQLKVWQYLPQECLDSINSAYAEQLGSRPVAVRTSGIGEDGALSFAGIGQSFPKVSGEHDLASAIVGVIASSSTTKARQYLEDTNDPRITIDMPVWIHPTINSHYSAVVFTRNPGSGRKQMIIQGIKGFLGNVVDATVEPDTIVFEKDATDNYRIAGIPHIGSKAIYEFTHQEGTGIKKIVNTPAEAKTFCLPVPVLKKILEKVDQLDAIYGNSPDYIAGLDLELAIDQDNYVHTVQIRPITTGKMIDSVLPALETQLQQSA